MSKLGPITPQDIIDECRRQAGEPAKEGEWSFEAEIDSSILHAAANEIERLQKEIEELRVQVSRSEGLRLEQTRRH
jgi:hypothetical protein